MTRVGGPHPAAEVPRVAALASVERLVAHAAAGTIARLAPLAGKLWLADVAADAMVAAVALRDHARAMAHRDPAAVRVSARWVTALSGLDDPEAPDALVPALAALAPEVVDRYREVLDRADPLYDARLRPALEDGIRRWEQIAGSAPAVGGAAPGPAVEALSAAMAAAWHDPSPMVPIEAAVWPPADRVLVPARTPGAVTLEPGAPLELYGSSRADPDNVRHALHESVIGETCALELMARSTYEHPDLAWEFHVAAARHGADEARHARIFLRLLEDRGGQLGDGPMHTTLYSAVYTFPPCEPGSKQELAWRLLVLCTCLEGLAIDQFAHEERLWSHLDQPDLAQAVSCVLADELFHAESGLRWTERICAEHQMAASLERELAHAWFGEGQRRARDAYVAADAERAAREQALLDQPDDEVPFHSRVETELRRRAGFSDDLLDQVRRWGYHPGDRAAAPSGDAATPPTPPRP